MTTKNNKPQQNNKKDFGLPQVEFKPIETGIGKWLKVTAIIVGFVLLIGAGFVSWFFYHAPAHDDFSTGEQTISEVQESDVPEIDTDTISDDASAKHNNTLGKSAETSTLAKEPEVRQSEENRANFGASHVKSERGTVTQIKTPQGFYYIVVGSFIDEDLALDYANRLAQQGVDVMHIAPPQGQYYSRVAVVQTNTFRDAHEKIARLKAEYGANIWVMKY